MLLLLLLLVGSFQNCLFPQQGIMRTNKNVRSLLSIGITQNNILLCPTASEGRWMRNGARPHTAALDAWNSKLPLFWLACMGDVCFRLGNVILTIWKSAENIF